MQRITTTFPLPLRNSLCLQRSEQVEASERLGMNDLSQTKQILAVVTDNLFISVSLSDIEGPMRGHRAHSSIISGDNLSQPAVVLPNQKRPSPRPASLTGGEIKEGYTSPSVEGDVHDGMEPI
jgi:hypothetical protein